MSTDIKVINNAKNAKLDDKSMLLQKLNLQHKAIEWVKSEIE